MSGERVYEMKQTSVKQTESVSDRNKQFDKDNLIRWNKVEMAVISLYKLKARKARELASARE